MHSPKYFFLSQKRKRDLLFHLHLLLTVSSNFLKYFFRRIIKKCGIKHTTKLHERENKNHNYFILRETRNILVETYN